MPQKIITETTMQRILSEIKATNILMNDLATGYTIDNWATVAEIVQKGLAPVRFNIGDSFIANWVRTDVETDKREHQYKYPWKVAHFGDIKDENGDTHPAMFLVSAYCTPFSIVFDAAEYATTTDAVFQEGYYYYKDYQGGEYRQQEVEAGAEIPSDGRYVRSRFANAQGIITQGYSNWKDSAIRQWLNSDADAGAWWKPQHGDDVDPKSTHDGFMKGFDPEFLEVVKPIQIATYKYVTPTVAEFELEITNDRFFLPSAEEVYGAPTRAGEGIAWDYFKEATGFENPNNNATPGRIIPSIDDKYPNPMNRIWLRSPSLNDLRACSMWGFADNGAVTAGNGGGWEYCQRGNAVVAACAIY